MASRMKKLIPILILLTTILNSFSEEADSLQFKPLTILIGPGIGTRSHIGNMGLTSNFFLTKNFNVKLSLGYGPIDSNGGIISAGPEFCIKTRKKPYFFIGSAYSISGAYKQTNGDNTPPIEARMSSGAQYIRSYVGIAIPIESGILKIEAGYSYVLKKPSYTLSGPWTSSAEKRLQKSFGSGLLVTISFQFWGQFSKK